MKILIINWQDIKNPFGGGAEVHLHEIFKRVVALGHDVTLFCGEYDGCKKYEVIDGIKVIRKGKRNTFNYYVKKQYKEHFEKIDFDIVIDDINKIPFYTPKYVKKPLLAISHHFFGTSIFRETNVIAGLYVLISEYLVNSIYKSTPFAVVSQSTLDEFLRRGFNQGNFSIIPNAIEHKEFPMQIGQKNDDPTITYFGRLKKYKSVDHLLKAFAIVQAKIPNAKLWIMGKGDFMDYLKTLANKLNISQNTKFFGFVTNEEKVELLSKSYIAVNTSMKEGWGITNIEANACGTPVLSANVPGLRDSVKEGVSGMLYKYGDINELARKLIKFIEKDELQKSLFNGSIKWASEFSWESSAKKMVELCNKVIAEHKLK